MWDEYLNSIKTRLSANGKIILIQTRWHEDDLAGRIIAQDVAKCRVINLPCEAEDNDILGRHVGDALFAEIGKDNAWLQEFKSSYTSIEGTRAWQSLYQGHPTAIQGSMLKLEWWRYYDVLPDKMDRIVQSWDCAFKGLTTSDYVVGQVWGMVGTDCYLIDQIRGQYDFPATVAAIQATKIKYPETSRIFVEDKANGSAVISTLTSKIPGIIPVTPDGGKIARVSAISPHIESGHVHLPRFGAFTGLLVDECTRFPSGTHDDQVDAMSQAINRMLYYRNIDKPQIQYVIGGQYNRGELRLKGFKDYEINNMVKVGRVKLIGR